MEALSPSDPNSFSRPEECIVIAIHIDWDVNFEKQVLDGFVDLAIEKKDPSASHLVLDIRDLTIKNVVDKSTEKSLNYVCGEPVLTFGSKLEIELPDNMENRKEFRIFYETIPSCSALQWLKPELTAGKKHPYLYSHSEAIHARSMIPCQDSPGVKCPYTAVVRVPKELVVLMSAVRDGEEDCKNTNLKTFKFTQKVPVPSYLIAIVVGALESREIGPRSRVWSEKEFVDKSAFEFSETEEMLNTAEKLLGPYVWGIYDLLILPPSFPFGGMENPCLTFVTPTLLAGDRSLSNVVGHEISHSWTGNLVTNKNFQHFWLNEGFTVFVERKIAGRMHGESHRQFQAVGGWKELQYTIDTRGKDDPLTKLVPDLRGVDPDDSFSTVPYEKGHTLLFYLEQKLGGPEIFEPFLRAYLEKYKYKSLDTDEWKEFLYEYFKDMTDKLDEVDWNAWLHTPGMPPIKPDYDMSLVDCCTTLCKNWIAASDEQLDCFSSNDIAEMSSQQIIEFLAQLLQEEPLSVSKVKKITELYGLRDTQNSEIKFRWLRLGLRSHWKDVVENVIKFVSEVGRMKFVRPLFRDLFAWDETRDTAVETYRKNHSSMMYVTAYTVGKDLCLTDE
ncbi:leukotriene A-4 hydrolase isoform X2 [Tachypleus tridentatus]|uniref:leukotriene A-4 hydrolase isoform X2 n=1 Tax=Tachypleus tridentatus TaxID=6853 RepID=UPI003FD284ED